MTESASSGATAPDDDGSDPSAPSEPPPASEGAVAPSNGARAAPEPAAASPADDLGLRLTMLESLVRDLLGAPGGAAAAAAAPPTPAPPVAASSPRVAAGMDDIVRDFVEESREALDLLERDLLTLEQDPEQRPIVVKRVFGAVHTIKGTAGFLGFGVLERLAHEGENLLSDLREGRVAFSEAMATTLLQTSDALRRVLTTIEREGHEGDEDPASVAAELRRHRSEVGAAPDAPGAAARALEAAPVEPSGSASSGSPGRAEGTIRVDVNLLDRVMNLVGELVLARNQVLQFAGASEDRSFLATAQRLNLVTSELQEGVMRTRMQPIGNVWSRLPRLVRDLALQLGKQVDVLLEGEETELDRSLLEAVRDPLTHIVRNAVDHGIESPAARRERGKPGEGRLELRAFHEGGHVNIEVSDDGAGIDPERVKRRAIGQGLLTPAQAESLSESELLRLIFAPGLTTAERVSNLSGRGVGMDVVRSNIEAIGGTIDVASALGEGTCLKVKIPLTLAIIPALIVLAGGAQYAIPQVNLLELVLLEGEARSAIETVQGQPVYRLRGDLLPLVFLHDVLRPGRPRPPAGDAVSLVVLQAGDRSFGLVVDRICDTEEIVVKPLSKRLKAIGTYAGATIMGDGRVALILDVVGLAKLASVVADGRDDGPGARDERSAEADGEPTRSLLLVGLGQTSRVGIALDAVARLEEVPAAAIERAAGREVMQYRGRIMPLVCLADRLGHARAEARPEPVPVVVVDAAGGEVGLVVDRIVDIVDEAVRVEDAVVSAGLVGTAVVQGRVTDLLDLSAIEADARGPARLLALTGPGGWGAGRSAEEVGARG